MAIISLKNRRLYKEYGRTQFRYAATYVIITLIVLIFLNFYCSAACKRWFYHSKQRILTEIAQLTSQKLSDLDTLSSNDVPGVIHRIHGLQPYRVVVTDQMGYIIYDTAGSNQSRVALFPKVVSALKGNQEFTWQYRSGVMRSETAAPIISDNTIIGCVYMMEHDTEQGAVIHSLQMTILTGTAFLELIVLIYSIAFSEGFNYRLRKIMNSMRIIQDGNYSQTVTIEGNDELAFLAKEFNDLTSRLQISENKRRQFVSDASHELKTPLATIKLLADTILQNDMDTETIREFVGDIGDEAERLNHLTQKLLDLTRGENPAEEDVREIIYMAPTVEKVEHMLSPLAQSMNITITTQLHDDAPILIREDDLYRIVFNLAENGLKYNTPHGALSIRLCRNDTHGMVQVADTGCGIPKESIGKIFERFYRVDKARSRSSGGSGLGLAIVRNMVERNQGSINVESEIGTGSTFTVAFPIYNHKTEAKK